MRTGRAQHDAARTTARSRCGRRLEHITIIVFCVTIHGPQRVNSGTLLHLEIVYILFPIVQTKYLTTWDNDDLEDLDLLQ